MTEVIFLSLYVKALQSRFYQCEAFGARQCLSTKHPVLILQNFHKTRSKESNLSKQS